ncbi:MAG: tetratricopeptide repeat protein, partial [Planctomycetes bacterium]|nr:tetratricopeptide repeat protein [Planctomycetota bacterium]
GELARLLSAAGRDDEAIQAYREVIQAYRKDISLDPKQPAACNSLAWLLATCPNPRLRDTDEALQLAETAVELAPDDANYRNTLGVARYRAGRWNEALGALSKAEDLAPGKSSAFNGFFLAMACWQLDDREQAREWYDSSVAWLEQDQPLLDQNSHWPDELRRFRAEAEELMGLNPEEIRGQRSEVSAVEAPRPQQNQPAATTDN